jgi:predicted nucleotidyltransferase component of viral defense system
MIEAREQQFWETQVQWSTQQMIEQDYLICQAVDRIFSDRFLRQHVAMRGGTVLHKSHLAPASRYSEDIDLVLVTEDRRPGHIRKALVRVLAPLLGAPSESWTGPVQLAIRNLLSKSQIIRLTWRYSPIQPGQAMSKLKVEVNVNEHQSVFNRVSVDMTVPSGNETIKKIQVPSYDLNEMLATKIRALLQRDHGRDLFDLWRAWQVSEIGDCDPLDFSKIGSAFRHYMVQEGTTLTQNEIADELNIRMKSNKFLNDMNGYLPLGAAYSPTDACDVFNKFYLPHL